MTIFKKIVSVLIISISSFCVFAFDGQILGVSDLGKQSRVDFERQMSASSAADDAFQFMQEKFGLRKAGKFFAISSSEMTKDEAEMLVQVEKYVESNVRVVRNVSYITLVKQSQNGSSIEGWCVISHNFGNWRHYLFYFDGRF